MKLVRRRALLLAASLAASGVVGSTASLALSGCDVGNAASPQSAANLDSGLGSAASDGGTVTDSSADASADASMQDTGVVDSGDAGLNGCSTFTDSTAKDEVDLTWDFSIKNQPDRCTTIKVGKAVKWTGSFTVHPLEAFGGDGNNPITGTPPDAGAILVTFPTTGVFGYNCQNHPNQMFGVVVVVP